MTCLGVGYLEGATRKSSETLVPDGNVSLDSTRVIIVVGVTNQNSLHTGNVSRKGLR